VSKFEPTLSIVIEFPFGLLIEYHCPLLALLTPEHESVSPVVVVPATIICPLDGRVTDKAEGQFA